MRITSVIVVGMCGLLLASPRGSAQDAHLGMVTTWETILGALEEKGLEVDPASASDAFIEAIARSIDPQSRLVGTEEIKEEQLRESGTSPGFGLRVSITNGTPVIHLISANSPAEARGLAVGDQLMSLDGTPLTDLPLPVVTRLLRQASTQEVDLVYRTTTEAGLQTQTVTLARSPVPHYSLETAEALPGGIGYVLMNGMYTDAGKDTVMRLREWSETGSAGLILDLRGAGGADPDAAMSIAALFCPGGSLVYTVRDRNDQDLLVQRCDQTSPLRIPAILLIDRYTHGLAEALAGALKDASSGVLLLGETTSGDLGLREFVTLPAGQTLRIATRKLVTVSGTTYDGTAGVIPDIHIPSEPAILSDYDPEPVMGRRAVLTEEWEDRSLRQRTRGDQVLQRAVDILLGMRALNLSGEQQ
ncbi:MAG: PDZ domain-containing protein [Kiritimatiellae bacterium]|nr:PDZ domain-containing protein [Kiritimatiellia bacterium]